MSSPEDLDRARYAAMRWNTPLSEEHAALLLDRLDLRSAAAVLDLGCGWGELLVRAAEAAPASRATGVDTDEDQLERGRALALRRGVEDRVSFVCAPAQAWSQPAERILCIGATHAWGQPREALAALARLLPSGGRLLLGEGVWERPPNEEALSIFGEGILTLGQLVRLVGETGLRVLHMSVADQREWDDFESSWRAGRVQWLLANPGDPRAPQVAQELQARLAEYVEAYRGLLGFAYLVLTREQPMSSHAVAGLRTVKNPTSPGGTQ